MNYPILPDEEARLAALYELALLDTPEEPAFDRVTRLVTQLLNVPTSTVTLIDAKRQWIKSRVGTELSETTRDVAFCAHTIAETTPLVVEDAREDPRFADNPLVAQPGGVRFYAGIPLRTSKGLALGSLCAVDTRPRQLSDAELNALKDLGAIVTDEIHLRERFLFERQRREASQSSLEALHLDLENQIERRTRELNLVIESAYDAYISIDDNDIVLDWNRAATTMFGWTRREALARPIQQLIFPDGVPEGDQQTPVTYYAARRDGSSLPVEIRIKSLDIEGRNQRSLFLHDVTERIQLERLRDLEAREDALTQLPNRRALDERLPEAMARTRRQQTALAVLFMDLDGFKAVNDLHGHAAGDELLREIAKRLGAAVRETDYVARWAGDEFVVLLENIALDAAERLARQLVDTLEQPVQLQEAKVHVSASIGVALYKPDVGETALELLKRADVAMYNAKHAGKAQVYMADAPE
ncbi:PAS domain S-box-containing protein/diguanylate cyclase (GGDEF) domain-containing protein [Vreelandella subterranea]|uniref:PAS domain S-box-containing protein/diguanylate cyclase (GGDEF) domain-containing protein n=1 Tax=Vreelandella subterranea TaxID=416874 RepID=A0A1H9SYA1_9GAMM|nr:diguanylate cyclase [Halomonas subterranea]SER89363.1 PAS domain S-box-containing protein/diguanylate cyclase (GGDEF) domain-containing protein [Halomonas subterranea]